jgi:hypothetical protein
MKNARVPMPRSYLIQRLAAGSSVLHLYHRTAIRKFCITLAVLAATSTFGGHFPFAASVAAAQEASNIDSGLEQGRILLEQNDTRAVDVLRTASQQSLTALTAAIGAESTQRNFEAREKTRLARDRAARAHFLWGTAADRFGRRDEGIAALGRAVSLSRASDTWTSRQGLYDPRTQLARDAANALNAVLKGGLPFFTADDTLDVVAAEAHGGLWKPRRLSFTLRDSIVKGPVAHSTPSTKPTPVITELLVTSGKLFPPENPSAPAGTSRLSRIPPLYAAVPPGALPAVLRMDRMVVGYLRETKGPNAGLWKQVVRVYYASSYLTKENRDDLPRAEALCEQFLKVAATTQLALGTTNSWSLDNVTTLWLSEVSAWWPQDDEEPIVAAQLPERMPFPNTPLVSGGAISSEVKTDPLQRPWRASAQIDSAPGEIMFFKMNQPREEGEWLRQLMHEWGHVALPPFDGFAPPLEPYGNGALGETLMMLWATSSQSAGTSTTGAAASSNAQGASWAPHVPSLEAGSRSVATTETAVARNAATHADLNAFPAFAFWKKMGPNSALRRAGTTDGLQYLTGLALYVERIYGAPVLGRAFQEIQSRARTRVLASMLTEENAPRSDALLNEMGAAFKSAFAPGQKVVPIWLQGTWTLPPTASTVAFLERRGTVGLAQGVRNGGWLYIPAEAKSLRVFYTAKAGSTGIPHLRALDGLKSVPRAEGGDLYSSVLSFNGFSGWREVRFEASTTMTIVGAQLER